MPIYEYKCQGCGNVFEFLQLPASDEKPECPKCQSRKLESVISTFGFSTPGMRKANAKKSREAQKAAYKDQAIEDHRHFHEHHDGH